MQLITRTEAEQNEKDWWPVWNGGYVTVEEGGKLFIAPTAGEEQYYSLTKARRIHRDFAGVNDAQSAVKFANDYGLLFGSFVAEQLDHWVFNATRVRGALALWEKTNGTDFSFVTSRQFGSSKVFWTVACEAGIYSTVCFAHLKTERDAARHVLQSLINEQMAPHLAARIVDYKRQLTLIHAPANLLGQIWLRVAMEVCEMRRRGVCQNCGKQFGAKRIGKKWCGDKCRIAFSRKKARQPDTTAPDD